MPRGTVFPFIFIMQERTRLQCEGKVNRMNFSAFGDALKNWRTAFTWERIVCRLLAAYFCGASITLNRVGDGFAKLNYAESATLVSLILMLLGIFALLSVVNLFLSSIETDSWALLLFSTSCVWRWLDEFSHKTDTFLFTLTVIAVWSLIVIDFFRRNRSLFARWQPSTKSVVLLASAATVVAAGILISITCLRYRTFSSPNFDFGLFCNMFYNMKETGLPLVTSERDMLLSHFAVHVSPSFYFLLPLYILFPYPETLQVGQALFLMAGVIPIILLARHFKLSGKITAVVAALYVFSPALSAGCFYDIHENCFLPFFLLWTFYFFETKRYIPMYLAALCVLGVKEDAAIYLLIFAAFVFLSEKKRAHGLALAGMAVAYFGVAYYLLQTYGTGVLSNRFDNLIADKDAGIFSVVGLALKNPGYLLTQLFTTNKGNWDKIVFLLQMLLPIGFLPFCSKRSSRWILLAPILINLVSHYQYLYNLGFQYHFAVTAFFFYAALKNLPDMTLPTRRNLLALAMAACFCLYLTTVIPKLSTYTDRWEKNQETYTKMEAILDSVPEDASVNCSSFLLAHMADRDEIYEVNYHGNKPDVDFVVLDVRQDSQTKTKRAYYANGYTLWAEYEEIVILVSPTYQPTN